MPAIADDLMGAPWRSDEPLGVDAGLDGLVALHELLVDRSPRPRRPGAARAPAGPRRRRTACGLENACAGFEPMFGLMARGSVPLPAPAPPAQGFAQARREQALASVWARVEKRVHEPACAWVDARGQRHVEVLGLSVLSFTPEGRISPSLWSVEVDGMPRLGRCAPADVVLDGLPWRWDWLARMETLFLRELGVDGASPESAPAHALAREVFASVRRQLRQRPRLLRTMRERIARALELDPLALSVARLGRLVHGAAPTIACYNRAIEQRRVHAQLQQDAPQLQLAFWLLSGLPDFPARGEPLQRLRRFVTDHGVSERGWRMLAASGPALWRPMARFYATPSPQAALDYLRLVDSLGWREPAHPGFMRAVLALRGGPRRARQDFHGHYEHLRPTVRRLVDWFEHADASRRQAMLEALHRVLGWLDSVGSKALERPGTKLRWTMVQRRAQQWWEQRLALQQAEAGQWAVPVNQLIAGAWRIEFIDTAHALYEEARAMRHCAFDYVDHCAIGVRLIGSVRRAESGQRVATAMYRRTPMGWQLEELAGFANRAAPPDVQALCAREGLIAG